MVASGGPCRWGFAWSRAGTICRWCRLWRTPLGWWRGMTPAKKIRRTTDGTDDTDKKNSSHHPRFGTQALVPQHCLSVLSVSSEVELVPCPTPSGHILSDDDPSAANRADCLG